jgi:predicted metallo-beta-lactamase superfamily hydrolase
MKILPVAFDSLGVRSMATYVETNDVRIFIDPGIALSPDRYSLPPHQLELDRHRELWNQVKHWVSVSDIVVLTHYHYDHHNPDELILYENKDVFLKDPIEQINQSQKERAAVLLSAIEPCAKTITIADGRTFNFGKTRLSFSAPVNHGLASRHVYVIELMIEEKERFVFTSDVEGPLNDAALSFIIDMNPESIIVDGPPTYLVGSHYRKQDIQKACDNLKQIIERTAVKTLIIDHHLLRDLNWQQYVSDLERTKRKVVVCSAAHVLGKEEDILEARRKELYAGVRVERTC